jgi:hypothetical protein
LVSDALLGSRIVRPYDGWLNLAADMLFRGYRYNSPTEEQQRFFDWIASLGDEERVQAFAFVREMLGGVVLGILKSLDDISVGFVLEGEVREQLLISVAFARWNGDDGWASEDPLEVITINTRESRERGIELYRLWFDWKEKYSRWEREQGHSPGGQAGV